MLKVHLYFEFEFRFGIIKGCFVVVAEIDCLDCLYVMNELLYLHYNPKEADVKAFENYELA